ncbi:MAG: SDR family NAD(P)-dependent oxidoreductase [Anaerolineae bacterium]|nr:SDR family NAD(P)-dependent oxidoreductase [Anaerolineae bacterium]
MPTPVVLITGASSGIGSATAHRLAQAGYQVFGTSRTPEVYQATLPFPLLSLDVRDEASAQACVEAVLGTAGRVDVLFNNAGVDFLGALEETALEEVQAHFETNFFGAVRMMRAVLPAMRAQRSGKLINMSSVLGLMGAPFQGLYTAAKHALEGYSEALWYEVKPLGIHVSLIEAGTFRTQIAQRRGLAALQIEDYAPRRERVYRAWHRMADEAPPPEPVARLVQRIIETETPHLRYPVARGAEVLATFFGRRRLVPDEALFAYVNHAFDVGDLRYTVAKTAPVIGGWLGAAALLRAC